MFYIRTIVPIFILQVFLGGKHPPDVTEALADFTEMTSVPTPRLVLLL